MCGFAAVPVGTGSVKNISNEKLREILKISRSFLFLDREQHKNLVFQPFPREAVYIYAEFCASKKFLKKFRK